MPTIKDLKALAKAKGMKGYSKLRKAELTNRLKKYSTGDIAMKKAVSGLNTNPNFSKLPPELRNLIAKQTGNVVFRNEFGLPMTTAEKNRRAKTTKRMTNTMFYNLYQTMQKNHKTSRAYNEAQAKMIVGLQNYLTFKPEGDMPPGYEPRLRGHRKHMRAALVAYRQNRHNNPEANKFIKEIQKYPMLDFFS